jgi:D-beta-D-heptose 7-phosphate kinase/D-beta-D-heptose 1-phosphate adenosyltransferase
MREIVMITDLSQTIDRFAGLNALVIGEAMLDSYLEGTSGRLCQEAPVPVVSVTCRRDVPGGAANTALNVRSLGAQVAFLSVSGDDSEAAALRTALRACDVSTENLLARPSRRTLAKQRVLAASQLLVRFDQGDTAPVEREDEEALIQRLQRLFPLADVVILSDYSYGILTPRVIAALADLQARFPRTMVGDSKRLAAYRRVGLTAVKPNFAEALQLLGMTPASAGPSRLDTVTANGQRLLERTGARIAAVTLDCEGALTFERDRAPYRTYAKPNPQSRAAGAGDTFVSALALALAAGADATTAAELAAAAAAVVVEKDGTASCTGRELRAFVSAQGKVLADRDDLAARLEPARRQGKRLVLTNGCFDLLHRGHVTYLSRAKALGDLLVVGVNTDESVRRLKGSERPLNPLEDRMQVLAALSCVDYVCSFAEETPHALIRALRPDVFVKGGDYTLDRLPEAPLVAELGGVVRILSFVPDRSTTSLIERIRTDHGQPALAGPGPRHQRAGSSSGPVGTESV